MCSFLCLLWCILLALLGTLCSSSLPGKTLLSFKNPLKYHFLVNLVITSIDNGSHSVLWFLRTFDWLLAHTLNCDLLILRAKSCSSWEPSEMLSISWLTYNLMLTHWTEWTYYFEIHNLDLEINGTHNRGMGNISTCVKQTCQNLHKMLGKGMV